MEVALQVTVDGKQTGFSIKVFESDKTLKGAELLNNIKQGLMTKFDLKRRLNQVYWHACFIYKK